MKEMRHGALIIDYGMQKEIQQLSAPFTAALMTKKLERSLWLSLLDRQGESEDSVGGYEPDPVQLVPIEAIRGTCSWSPQQTVWLYDCR